jgi:hypothetical protein
VVVLKQQQTPARDQKVLRRGWCTPFETWLDGVEAGWAVPALLAGFVAVWMAFLVVAYINADLHPDVLEAWSIGRSFSWGNAKHPPLMGWVARAWSTVFPLRDWSFQLLAMVNSALALWAVDLIARRFVRGDKRVIVLLLLMLLPAYQFHAQRFNANTVLLAIWPLATYSFLRSFETRSVLWACMTGVLCALAMLGKYYSIFLVGGFVFAAIAHPQRRAYLTSAAPWLSTAAGLVALAPHIYWLATTGAGPFKYAMAVHSGFSLPVSLREAVMFVLGICAYLAIPAIVWLLMVRTRLGDFVRDLRSLDPGLLLLALIFAATLVLPAVTAITLRTDMPSLWDMQGLFFAIVLAVCCTRFAIDRFETVKLSAGVLIFSLGALIAAPIHAIYRNTHPYNEDRGFLSLAADEMTRQWRKVDHGPMEWISGSDSLAFAMAFYGADHPVYSRPFRFQYDWPLPHETTLRRGWAGMCFSDDASCVAWLRQVRKRAESGHWVEFSLQRSLWGRAGTSEKVMALLVPPHGVEPPHTPDNEQVDDLSARRRGQ